MKYPLHQVRNNLYHYSASLRRQILCKVYGMKIGHNTRVSRSARLDKTNPKGVHIGESTSISYNVNVLAHDFINRRHVDTYIGSYCFIGGGSTILPGVRIGDHCIIGAGSVVMNDIPPNCIAAGNPARLIRSGIMTSEYGILEENTLDASQKFGEIHIISETSSKQSRDVLAFIKAELGIESELLYKPVQDTPVDSFALITLRSAIEARFQVSIPDLDWAGARALAEIAQLSCFSTAVQEPDTSPSPTLPSPVLKPDAAPVTLANLDTPNTAPAAVGPAPLAITEPGRAKAVFGVDMPQMALSGLSEAWMMKEIGNIHWKLISDFLQMPSSKIQDQSGERLYATFTRIKWESSGDLKDFRENDHIDADARLQRFGASFYFSKQRFSTEAGTVSAEVMSTFAKHGERGANTSLIKGTPVLAQPDAIPQYEAFPDFGKEYRSKREAEDSTVIFESEYEIMGPHDINGVGLLYFAAYPVIFDICTEAYEGKGFLRSYSSVGKDLYYFANAEPDETLVFRIHERRENEGVIAHLCTLSRKSDGKRMAQVHSLKRASDGR